MEKKISGNNARKWRQMIAAAAVRPGKTTRALKWRLQVNTQDPMILDNAEALYNVTEGKNKGSLSYFLFLLITSGFRVFSSSGRAQSFANEKILRPAEFNAAAVEAFGQRAKKLTSVSLITVMTSGKRKENANFTKENVLRFLFQAAEIQVSKFDSSEPLDQALNSISDQWVEQFESWQQLNQKLSDAFSLIENRFAEAGMSSLGIAAHLGSLKEIAPKNTPIQFDEQIAKSVNPAQISVSSLPHVAFSIAAFCGQDSQPALAAQAGIVTENNNALSWLFGTGLNYWKTTPVREIMSDFEVGDEFEPRIKLIQEAAQAIPANPLFTDDGYAKFRSNIGGGIASWLANYGRRLKELRESVDSIRKAEFALPEGLGHELMTRVWLSMDIDYATLQDILANIDQELDLVSESLNRLEGKGKFATEEDIQTIEAFSAKIDRASAYLNMLSNRVEQLVESGADAEKRIARTCKLDGHEVYRPMKKINQLNGGVPDYINDANEMLGAYNALQQVMRTHFEKIMAYVGQQTTLDTVSRVQRLIEKKAEKLNKKTPVDSNLQAKLKILDRIGNATRVCSEESVRRASNWFEQHGFFKYPAQLHTFLFNRRGQIVHNAYSKSRHQGYEMDYQAIQKVDLDKSIQTLVDEMKKHAFESVRLLKDYHQVERAWYNIQLSGIDECIPADVAKPQLEDETIPMGLQLLLDRGEVSGQVTQKLFNLYHSKLNEMATKLFREEFTIKMRFQQVGDNALIYRPKDVDWQPPQHVFATENVMHEALKACGFKAGEKKSVQFAIRDLYKVYAEDWSQSNPQVTSMMSQAPHDWYFSTGITGIDAPIEGISVSKDGMGKLRSTAGVRLIGPSSYKAEILKCLKGELNIGDITLLVERVFKQKVHLHSDGAISMDIEEMPAEWWVVTPINQPENLKVEAPDWMERVVAIDLGERGLGYAVFDLNTREVMKDKKGHDIAGTKAIRSIRQLAAAAYRYKNTNQKRQKYAQKFDTRMMGHRKNVVGDVSHVINDLCARFNAFPVLENRIGQYESGAGQIELVYGEVTSRYLFSDIEADKSLRKSYWLGSDRWLHPAIKRKTNVDGKEVVKPLNIFPGAGVNPAGTSQECSCCGRNAIKTIRDSSQSEFPVNDHGIVQLEDGMVILKQVEPMSQAQARRLAREIRHQKKRPQLNSQIPTSVLDKDELIRIVRNNMRRAPVDTRSKDTTQSRYICVYADCGKARHADENAAVNIGRRFVASLV